MTNLEIIKLNEVLNYFSNKKTPFSLNIAKNSKAVIGFVEKYNEKRIETITKFAVLDENGAFLGRVKEDGTRVENPQTLFDIEIEDMGGLTDSLHRLDVTEVDFEPEKIDITKVYYDSDLKEKVMIEDYINTNVEANIIASMIELKLIEL